MSLREKIEELSNQESGEFTESARALFAEFKEALNRGVVRAAEREGGRIRVRRDVGPHATVSEMTGRRGGAAVGRAAND